MIIGMILDKNFPPDIRVEKEARALLDAGHAVHLLAFLRRPEQGKPEEEVHGIRVHRIPHPRSTMSSLRNRWNTARHDVTFVNPYWAHHIERCAREFRWEAFHAHDLQVVGSALSVAQPLGIPVVADLHENKPDQFAAKRASYPFFKRFRHAVFDNTFLWRYHERTSLRRCDGIIVVVDEMAERLHPYGIPPEKIITVSNTDDASAFQEHAMDRDIIERYRDQWIVTFIGGWAAYKGIGTLIRALPLAAPHIPNFKCVIAGAKTQEYIEKYANLAVQLGVEKHVDLMTWVPFQKVRSLMAVSAAGIIPFDGIEQCQASAPHKIFQYMISGVPVVVSDVRSLKRIIGETGAGLTFEAGNPSSLARVLVDLYKNPDLRERLGRNGYEASRGPYSWKHDASRLVKFYDTLNGARPQGRTG